MGFQNERFHTRTDVYEGENDILRSISGSVYSVTTLAVGSIVQQIDSYHGYWSTFVDDEKI